MDQFLRVTSHDFKTHLSRYIRLLHSGAYKGIVIKQYKRETALLMAIPPNKTVK